MGQPQPVSLGVKSNPARNQQAGSARLTNCFAEEQDQEGKVTWIIYGTSGLTDFGAVLEGGAIRAMIAVGQTLYVVAGRSIHAVNASGVGQRIGGIPTDGAVYMERNRRIPAQIGVVSDGLYFVIDTTANTVTQIESGLSAPSCIATMDGYGILPVTNSAYMLTAIDDFASVNPLDRGTCEAYPDAIVRCAVLEQQAVFFGETSIEWHQDTGAATFPFARTHAIEVGCAAPDSVAKVDTPQTKTLIWVAPDHTVRMLAGYAAQTISTNEIEDLIKSQIEAGNAAGLSATSWADAGRFYYALSCADWTKVFDAKRLQWHDRKSYQLPRWRVGHVVPFGTRIIAGDYATGQLYVMSDAAYDEAGEHLVSEIVTPPVHAFPYGLKFNALYIDAATGVGLNMADAHGRDPQIMVSWSDDGGVSWSAERQRSLGKLGQTMTRIQPIRRLGRTRKGRIFRFRISAPVSRVMLQISIDFDKLAA